MPFELLRGTVVVIHFTDSLSCHVVHLQTPGCRFSRLLPLFGFISVDMEEWRQCGRWLIDCKVLPPNHRVVWPSAVVFDLAQALRDGVLLCQMLHNLSPGSVDLKQINFRPQMSQVTSMSAKCHVFCVHFNGCHLCHENHMLIFGRYSAFWIVVNVEDVSEGFFF